MYIYIYIIYIIYIYIYIYICVCVCVCVLRTEKRGLQLVFHASTLQSITQPLFNQFS